MAEKITAIYDIQVEGLPEVQKGVAKTTDLLSDMGKEAKAAFSDAAIDEATASIAKFNNEAEQTVVQFTNVKKELKELTKAINSGQLGGKQLQEATKRAAELTDQIGDTRTAIQKLASDTRVFDTLVEGARGLAAGFSIAQGAAGLLSKDSEALQKTILKVQSAMAVLTGVQEVANIVTTKGGIASQAYALALRAVDFVQKQIAVSATVAWGAVTAGITLAVAAIGYLLYSFNEYQDEQEEAAKREQDLNNYRKEHANDLKLAQDQQAKNKFERDKLAAKSTTELANIERKYYEEQLARSVERQRQFQLVINGMKAAGVSEKEYGELVKIVADEEAKELVIRQKLADVEKTLKQELDKELEQRRKLVALGKEINAIATSITLTPPSQEEILKQYALFLQTKPSLEQRISFLQAFGLNAEDIEKVLAAELSKLDVPEKVVEIKVQPKLDEQAEAQIMAELEQLQASLFSSFNQIVGNITAANLQKLQSANEAQQAELQDQEATDLARYAGNEEKRSQIQALYAKKRERQEREFAYKKALLERQQAITNRDLGLSNIAINFAVSASKTAADLGFPAAIPFIAIAGANALIQAAVIATTPIPDLPKFKDGVIDFKGAGTETSDDNLVYISNRESVINARGTKKHKDALKAINEDNFGEYVYKTVLLPELRKSQRAQNEVAEFNDGRMVKTMREEHQRDREHARRTQREMADIIAEKTYLNTKHFGK